MIIAFDLDDVLCTRDLMYESLGACKYNYCVPVDEMISIVNNLYAEGHYIKIYTARGMGQFNGDVIKVYNHLFELTKKSLEDWDVHYHELIMGKPHYDIFIDDKAINSVEIKNVNDVFKFKKE